jgi:hypothetical protein
MRSPPALKNVYKFGQLFGVLNSVEILYLYIMQFGEEAVVGV